MHAYKWRERRREQKIYKFIDGYMHMVLLGLSQG
jgi:hypothetical protein